MACATIHLAIAKKYLENHPELDYEKIIAGTLYPDAAEDNDKTHYTDLNRGHDNISHVRGKVNLYAFLKEHEKLNDFELGWFLHLVTDYLFFEDCFTEKYLLQNSYEDFCKELYFAYNHLNLYLSEKYHIIESDYKEYPNEFYPGVPYEKCILPKEMIDDFIKNVSSIDLDKYIKKLKKLQRNVKPDVIKKPLYFYHLVNKDADISKGIISLQYMYDNEMYDLFDEYVLKYKNRILKEWNIEKYKGKDSLTREEYLEALSIFGGNMEQITFIFLDMLHIRS